MARTRKLPSTRCQWKSSFRFVLRLNRAFIHHPRTLKLIRDVVEELGCGLNDTYIDVPRLRMVTHGGYLTSGVGYAHHPHRDTWYSAPMSPAQLVASDLLF